MRIARWLWNNPRASSCRIQAHLLLCTAPGENTPAVLCVLPTQLCSSLPARSGSRGSPLLYVKNCSTSGATLSTRLMRSPSTSGTAGRGSSSTQVQEEVQE